MMIKVSTLTKKSAVKVLDKAFNNFDTEVKFEFKNGMKTGVTMYMDAISKTGKYFFSYDAVLCGAKSLEELAERLLSYEEKHKAMVDELNQMEEELLEYYNTYYGTPEFDWDFYSDWHKDVYGFRPR